MTVMAAGVNYNNVWAARGVPVNVIADRQRQGEPYDFQSAGPTRRASCGRSATAWTVSLSATTSWCTTATGTLPTRRRRRVGTRCSGRAPGSGATTPTSASFAQFALAQAHQLLPKAAQLTWAQAAAPTLVERRPTGCCTAGPGTPSSATTSCSCGAARVVCRQPGDPDRSRGRSPAVAVVSDAAKGGYCEKLAPSDGSTAATSTTGDSPRTGPTPPAEEVVGERAGVREGDLGRCGRQAQPAHRDRTPGRGHDPDHRASSATRAGWW